MKIAQIYLVTTRSKPTQPHEILWDAIEETEGFLSCIFAGIAYNVEKESLPYHWPASASAFGQENLDHSLLHSLHNACLCKNEAEELSKKSKELIVIYAMRVSNAVHSFRVPCTLCSYQTQLHTLNEVGIQSPALQSQSLSSKEWGTYVSTYRRNRSLRSCQLTRDDTRLCYVPGLVASHAAGALLFLNYAPCTSTTARSPSCSAARAL